MPTISVVVPLYNKAAYIDRCLDAILGQSFTDFEVIVVNDGSTDGSEKKVEQRGDSRIKLVHQANAGPGAARNRGAGMASGSWLAFLDGDDAWHGDYLKLNRERIRTVGPEVASLTWAMRVYPQDFSTAEIWKRRGIPEGLFRATADTDAAVIVAMLAHMLPSNTVMRKSAFDELGGFYERNRCLYSEDAWLYLKTLLRYSAFFDCRDLTVRFEDASELATNLKGVRPVEPFLDEPEGVRQGCPSALRPLADEVLKRRALKTASVYGFWGEFRRSRQLVNRFVSARDWRLPYFATAIAGCTPVAGWAGKLARAGSRMTGSRMKG